MSTITDGTSSNAATASSGTRTFVLPSSSPVRDAGRSRAAAEPPAGVGVGRRPDLGRLLEARGHFWAEAVTVRQRQERLSDVAVKVRAIKTDLEQFKLYPPYPVDEPRRAQTIRQFNGLAAEAARLVGRDGAPQQIGLDAPTAEAQQAIDSLGRLETTIGNEQKTARAKFSVDDGFRTESGSGELGHALGASPESRLTRASADILRQLV